MEPPLEAEEGIEAVPVPVVGGTTKVEVETIDALTAVASGSLPAACARVGSNATYYTQSVRHVEGQRSRALTV